MTQQAETLRPPEPPGILTWIKNNLFSSFFNGLLTLFSIAILYFTLSAVLRWLFLTADWRPITVAPILFAVGQYPREELWRIGVNLFIVSTLFGLSWGVWGGVMRSFAILLAAVLGAAAFLPLPIDTLDLTMRVFLLINPLLVFLGYWIGSQAKISSRWVLLGWLLSMVLVPFLLRGLNGNAALPSVDTSSWGGLMVNLLLAVGGIGLSFPIGVLLALGRRSSLPVLKIFCTLFIETVRGVPLISILFMSSIILALFLPPEFRVDRLIRALAGMTLFSAAYVAENVRGGLQAVPPGQNEAAKAIGLNNFQTTLLIVLPQALRAVIPTIVGQFISLFKDTTLAIIVAINEILNIGKSILQTDPEFLTLQAEVYVFIAAVFWVLSSLMSFASRRLEAALGVGER
jgi:general L-amino acid transport system permease protein